jgi:tryptophan synthase alpha chain
MSYLNPLLSYGLERLARNAREAGVSGCIVPDLPLEESLPVRQRFDAAGLGLVQLVTPLTPQDRAREICEASRGFVYAVTMTGTTGGRSATSATDDYFSRVREASSLPVLAGFGIRGPEQMKALDGRVDGAIVGSALIEVIERGDDPVAFLKTLRAAARDGRCAS